MMIIEILVGSLVAGIGHFILLGLLYGNPYVANQYTFAMQTSPAVRKWDSMGKYRLTQFLGTQVEVLILTIAYVWFRPALPATPTVILVLGFILAAIRVYPRFWNMWIQTTYPRNLLSIEIVNGTLGTVAIVAILEGLHR